MLINQVKRYLSSLAGSLLLAAPLIGQTCDLGSDICPCERTIVAEFDYLNWEATIPGNDYAIVEDGTALILGSANVERVRTDREAGFRGRIGYGVTGGWRASFAYTTFDTFGQSTMNHPGGDAQVFATQSHPSGNEETDVAIATASFDYKTFDLILDKTIHTSDIHQVNLFGGVRWAEIDQNMQARYDGRDFNTALIEKNQTTAGAGLRMGMQTNWILPAGFFLTGQMSGGLLFAETTKTHYEDDLGGTDILVDVRDARDVSVPFINTAAGLGWNTEHVSVLVGYELENWFGLQDRAMFVDALQEATFAPISEDVLLSGLFVRATFLY